MVNIREAIRESKKLKEELDTLDFVQWMERRDLQKPPSKGKVETAKRLGGAPKIKPLRKPYMNKDGTLVIPFDSNPQYHWWAGGQSIADTLAELSVPTEVWEQYSSKPYLRKVH
jgi:hypothetical protein